jgi:hypothetical protein
MLIMPPIIPDPIPMPIMDCPIMGHIMPIIPCPIMGCCDCGPGA